MNWPGETLNWEERVILSNEECIFSVLNPCTQHYYGAILAEGFEAWLENVDAN